MKEGFYGVKYKSVQRASEGFGIIVLDTGILTGVDMMGIKYDGSYKYSPSKEVIEAKVHAVVPPGVILVTNARVDQFDFELEFPKQTTGTPFQFPVPGGRVEAVIAFLRDFTV